MKFFYVERGLFLVCPLGKVRTLVPLISGPKASAILLQNRARAIVISKD
jgi:hypothetical protein